MSPGEEDPDHPMFDPPLEKIKQIKEQFSDIGAAFKGEFKGEAHLTSGLEVLLKRDERVMRFLTVALDKHALAYAGQRREKLNAKTKEEK